eukprot:CAMPEP_0204358378 /NCGR_PEP_ID=MMETSP0469-20131031/36472_1 /ASSEMBLY_ACC=CAM_ASM_000384 /TAXON_ID=2969 /ORGANISM="Oxyrrhis marina" /LENGTH=343 /DNA_ID=CAMNT_0051346237 /DNA_START=1 /DNA_END=1028 /DNA_ORIENTATION=+
MPVPWRFAARGPIQGAVRVVFAGSKHFLAALPSIRAALQAHGYGPETAELVQVSMANIHQEIPTAHLAIPFMEKLDGPLLRAAPELRSIVQFGTGLEGVDRETATKLGITVSNMPADSCGNAEGTAELAVYLAVALLKHPAHMQRVFESGTLGGVNLVRQLKGQRVTVVGFGAVGRVLCNALMALGAEVRAVRRTWSEDDPVAAQLADKASSIDEFRTRLAPTTDVLIAACPLTPETRGLVDAALVAALPPRACVINIGRGPLVDHGAVLAALDSGKLAGFATDVGVGHPEKPSEPWSAEDALARHPNAIFTPHVGGATETSYGKMAELAVKCIEAVRGGRAP